LQLIASGSRSIVRACSLARFLTAAKRAAPGNLSTSVTMSVAEKCLDIETQ
jgi:hypothetical protein